MGTDPFVPGVENATDGSHAHFARTGSGQQLPEAGSVPGQPQISTTALSDTSTGGTPVSVMGVSDTRSVRARKWSRIDSITIRNFKAVKEATVPLGGVTILVGPEEVRR
jgi:hypothetical protein